MMLLIKTQVSLCSQIIRTLSWDVGRKDVCPAPLSINIWLDIDSSELCIETGSAVSLRPDQSLNLQATQACLFFVFLDLVIRHFCLS